MQPIEVDGVIEPVWFEEKSANYLVDQIIADDVKYDASFYLITRDGVNVVLHEVVSVKNLAATRTA